MKNFVMFFLIINMLCSLCVSCGHTNQDDFLEEGKRINRRLIKELQKVHSRDDLVNSLPRLSSLFQDLVEVIITAREYDQKHPEFSQAENSIESREISQQLSEELNRVYMIDGARELIEKAQSPALHRLDAYEKQVSKTGK